VNGFGSPNSIRRAAVEAGCRPRWFVLGEDNSVETAQAVGFQPFFREYALHIVSIEDLPTRKRK